ncbi:hypothetical protein COHA_003292 [Chlorella ohadii]|uniref:Uncharacterized protein n=1 Tax=Chlorella ohadii TaxID=2649997 RepID=A0AAD5DVN7_9CHLO|nr:hypothetical protein COHA_003292 [Chlorella ohadii]
MSGVQEDEERSAEGQKRKRKPSSSKAGKSKKQATGTKSKGKSGKDRQARPDVTVTSREIASAAGAAWRALSADLKQQYESRGDAEKAKYAAAKKAQVRRSESQLSDGASPLDHEASEPPDGEESDAAEETPSAQPAAAEAAAAVAAAAIAAATAGGGGTQVASQGGPKGKPEAAVAKEQKPKCAAVAAAAAAAGAGEVRPGGAAKQTAARSAAIPKRSAARSAAAAAAAQQPRERRAPTPAARPPQPPKPPKEAAAPMPPLFARRSSGSLRLPAASSSTMLSDLAMPPAALPPGATAAGTAGAVPAAPADSPAVTGFSAFVQECRAAFQIHQPVLSFWLSTHPVIQVHIGNPQLGMHDLLPGLDQYLVSLAIQALAQDGLNSAIGAAGGLGADGRSDMSDKRCLLDLLLASDAGPPPPLLSLEATARETQRKAGKFELVIMPDGQAVLDRLLGKCDVPELEALNSSSLQSCFDVLDGKSCPSECKSIVDKVGKDCMLALVELTSDRLDKALHYHTPCINPLAIQEPVTEEETDACLNAVDVAADGSKCLPECKLLINRSSKACQLAIVDLTSKDVTDPDVLAFVDKLRAAFNAC